MTFEGSWKYGLIERAQSDADFATSNSCNLHLFLVREAVTDGKDLTPVYIGVGVGNGVLVIIVIAVVVVYCMRKRKRYGMTPKVYRNLTFCKVFAELASRMGSDQDSNM